MLLLHVPPALAFVSIALLPAHTLIAPPIEAGSAFTTTDAVVRQLVGRVYVIVVLPALMPLTTPVLLIVADEGLLLLQIPPALALDKVVVEPAHTAGVPAIAAGSGRTFTVAVRIQPVGSM